MEVKVQVDAIRVDSFPGTISQIVPEADMRARTFPVKIRVANSTDNASDNASDMIRPGMLARVILPIGEPVCGLTVHKDAINYGGDGPVVMKVVGDTAQPVPVKLIFASYERWLVKGDLVEGDQVVTRGNERLGPGQAIVIIQK